MQPIFRIILVEPEHPHNIGFCARAMRCSGLNELYVVYASRKVIPEGAWTTAHASTEVLDQATIVTDLGEALKDCQSSVAFSRRFFDIPVPHCLLPQLGGQDFLARSTEVRPLVALVFGRESKGLLQEELALCSIQCEIPMAGGLSLNLGQALSVVLYELTRVDLVSPPQGEQASVRDPLLHPPIEPATQGDQEVLLRFMMNNLSGRYSRWPWVEPSLRQFIQKLGLNKKELQGLQGIVRNLVKR